VDIFDVASSTWRCVPKRTSSSHVDTGRSRATNIGGLLTLKHARIRTRTRTHTRRQSTARHTMMGETGKKKRERRKRTHKSDIPKTIPTRSSLTRADTHVYINTHALTQRYKQHTPDAKTMRSRRGRYDGGKGRGKRERERERETDDRIQSVRLTEREICGHTHRRRNVHNAEAARRGVMRYEGTGVGGIRRGSIVARAEDRLVRVSFVSTPVKRRRFATSVRANIAEPRARDGKARGNASDDPRHRAFLTQVDRSVARRDRRVYASFY